MKWWKIKILRNWNGFRSVILCRACRRHFYFMLHAKLKLKLIENNLLSISMFRTCCFAFAEHVARKWSNPTSFRQSVRLVFVYIYYILLQINQIQVQCEMLDPIIQCVSVFFEKDHKKRSSVKNDTITCESTQDCVCIKKQRKKIIIIKKIEQSNIV